MTSSTVEDAPKGMTFLFNPNRINFATSRAKSVCLLVASPILFEENVNQLIIYDGESTAGIGKWLSTSDQDDLQLINKIVFYYWLIQLLHPSNSNASTG